MTDFGYYIGCLHTYEPCRNGSIEHLPETTGKGTYTHIGQGCKFLDISHIFVMCHYEVAEHQFADTDMTEEPGKFSFRIAGQYIHENLVALGLLVLGI